MATMHNDPTPTTREREVIVTNNTGTGHGHGFGGTLLAIVGIVVVLLVGWFAIQAISGSDGEVIPDDVNINVTDNSGGGDSTGQTGGSSDTGQ